jgi:hypothetical protein
MVNYSHVYANMRNDLFANTFPNITRWVTQQGWIEIGQDENSKSLVRAIDLGGLVWESSEKQTSIDDALHALENYLEKWFEKNT